MTKERLSLKEDILSYKNLLDEFFSRNYPLLDKDKYWRWICNSLLEVDKDIFELSPIEQQALLLKLNEIGNAIFNPELFMTLPKL